MRRTLGGRRAEYLLALLAFIREAHFWDCSSRLEIEDNVRELMSTHKELASLGQGSPGGAGALGLGLMRRPGAKQYNASPANPKVIAAYLREAFESGDPRLHVSDFFVLALGGFEEAEEGKRSSNSPEVA